MSQSTVTCRCGAVNFPIASELPAVTELCHCNPCRQTSGALYEAFVQLKESPPASALEKCTAFPSSQNLDRYFCSTCGTKLFLHTHSPERGEDRWSALAGAIDPPNGTQDVSKVEMNEWVSDTGDGGIAPFMTKLGGRDVPSFETAEKDGKSLSSDDLIKMTKTADDLPRLTKDDLLTAECRCGGVSIRVKPASRKETSTPENLVPIDDQDMDKYFGSPCACRDCRLHQGVTTAFWLYVPPSNIINPHTNAPIAQGAAALTDEGRKANEGLKLTHYKRNAGEYDAYRAFCSTCGASVFYNFSDRLGITNIGAGLVKAEEGVMARRWISWEWGHLSYKDSCVDREIGDAWMAVGEGEGVS